MITGDAKSEALLFLAGLPMIASSKVQQINLQPTSLYITWKKIKYATKCTFTANSRTHYESPRILLKCSLARP
jgi:hypothetical protein